MYSNIITIDEIKKNNQTTLMNVAQPFLIQQAAATLYDQSTLLGGVEQ